MNNRNLWTEAEFEKLAQLRDGERMTWEGVAAGMPGRTGAACMMAYYGVKRRQQRAVRAAAAEARADQDRARVAAAATRAAPPSLAEMDRRSRLAAQMKPVAVPADPAPGRDLPSSAAISTAKLILDSELRARIEILGPTGGMLGDPLPGRAALDKPRTKEWCGS